MNKSLSSNEMVEGCGSGNELHRFVPIGPGVVLWKEDRVTHVLVVRVDEFFREMDETFWQCNCPRGLESSSPCVHAQILGHLVAHGTIQLDLAEYPPTHAS